MMSESRTSAGAPGAGEAFGVRFFGERVDRHRDVRHRLEGVERAVLPSKTEVVRISGAVSPAARATARTVEVTIPPRALGRITVSTVRQRLTPSASAASRRLLRDEQQDLLAAAGDQRQHDDRQRDRAAKPTAGARRRAGRRRRGR